MRTSLAVLAAAALAVTATAGPAAAQYPGKNGIVAWTSSGDALTVGCTPTDGGLGLSDVRLAQHIAFSASGRYVAVSGIRVDQNWTEGVEGLFLADIRNCWEPRHIGDTTGPMAWSPDGMELVTSRAGDLIVLSTQTGETLRTLVTGDGLNPSWHPRGGTIAYETGEGVWTVPAGGGTPTLVLPGGRQPDWHPSGKVLGYIDAVTGRVMTARADGTGQRRTPIHARSDLAWSPDGRMVVVNSAVPDREKDCVTITIDGRIVDRYTAGTDCASVAWQPETR